jgi:uncharacterized protein
MGRLDRKALGRAPTNDWFRKAEAGEPDALFNLGLIYSTGDGVPLDYVSAHKWMSLAALKGSTEARTLRTELARDMSAAELAEAQRQAREWQRTHAH